jgi:pyruvate/2-oxoglutarate dehydrogenase complex dihydrolipoamide acyltransferase (E2) component
VRSLLEVDITDALFKLKTLRAPGRKVSFLSWFIKVLGDTIGHHPPVNGVHRGRNQVVTFTEGNISTIVEKNVEGTVVPLPLVLRDVNHKTCIQINDEIQSAIDMAKVKNGELVLGDGNNNRSLALAAALPQWLRLWVMRAFILNNPRRMHQMMGTVMVTSLGTVGRTTAWIIPTSMHPLSIGIVSLNRKPVFYGGEMARRDILHLTIALDHDVVDGMPAFRFIADLVDQLERGAGLDEV